MRAYTANMIPGGTTPTINVSQYDNDYAVTVTLIEGAEIYTPPVGATIRVEGTKPDGHGFEYPCTYQGNVVTMPIYTQMTVVSGRFPIELVVYQSGLRVGSCNIIFAVERAPLGEDTDISETVIPDIIDAAQSSAEAAQEAAEDAAESAASVASMQIVTEASGSVAAFSDGADDVAVKSLVAEITPVQSGSGDPSPTNIRPISGRTGLTVTRCGKNLIPYPYETQSATLSGITITVNTDGSVTINGTAASIGASGVAVIFTRTLSADLNLKSGDVIYFSAGRAYDANSAYCRLLYADNNSWISRITEENKPITITDSMISREINFQIWIPNGVTVNDMTFKPVVSLSPTEWQTPTINQTYPVTWETEAGTVYGGTLDVVSGVLTVDRICHTYEGGTDAVISGRSYDTTNLCLSLRSNDYPHTTGGNGNIAPWNILSDKLKTVTFDSMKVSTITNIVATQGNWAPAYAIKVDGCTTVEEYDAWCAENKPQLSWIFATPKTYQLTPTEVRTILGGNTIYTDAGDVTVEYVADTKLYIDNKIAELQALVLEN